MKRIIILCLLGLSALLFSDEINNTSDLNLYLGGGFLSNFFDTPPISVEKEQYVSGQFGDYIDISHAVHQGVSGTLAAEYFLNHWLSLQLGYSYKHIFQTIRVGGYGYDIESWSGTYASLHNPFVGAGLHLDTLPSWGKLTFDFFAQIRAGMDFGFITPGVVSSVYNEQGEDVIGLWGLSSQLTAGSNIYFHDRWFLSLQGGLNLDYLYPNEDISIYNFDSEVLLIYPECSISVGVKLDASGLADKWSTIEDGGQSDSDREINRED